jgi:hypothetical protein
MEIVEGLAATLLSTLWDVLPIALILFVFQFVVLRRPVPNPGRILWGFGFVLVGLALFLEGLELALFPLGRSMAEQLCDPTFLVDSADTAATALHWSDYHWVYVFGAAIGFATTVAEPELIAVSLKAEEVSGGAIGAFGLRIAVAMGVAMGIALGTWRIVTGHPLYWFIITGYVVVVAQTVFAPRIIVPLAYDSGGVTTSTVTVPMVTALGLGLASNIPGRDPLLDGFGLIAFASLFPMMTVMAYAQLSEWFARRKSS